MVRRIPDILPHIEKQYARPDVLNAKIGGQWKSWSIAEFRDIAQSVSYGLMHLGLLPGDKVAIISANRPEWNFADFGIAQMGAISVPVYPTMGASETQFILNDASVKVAFVADAALYEKVHQLRASLPELTAIYTFDVVSGASSFADFVAMGKAHPMHRNWSATLLPLNPTTY